MSKIKKVLFGLSVGLNIVLIAIIALGMIKMNFVKEQVLLTEVQQNLVELEGLIAHQTENNWSNPNLVTTELGDILNGIWLGKTTGNQLGTLSDHDKEILNQLYFKLNQYPNDKLYRFVDLTEKDKEDFEELRGILRDAGFGLNIQVNGNMKYFINQAKSLENNVDTPLN
jgi:hypothetical protein